MDVFTAIQNRRSIRAFKDKKIDEPVLNKVLEAARLAPSAANNQSWKFLVVKDQETRKKLAVAARGQKQVEQAPVVIVGISTEPEGKMPNGQLRGPIDLSIAFSFIMLEAIELGLGTCWLGAYDEGEVKKILGIPENVRVIAMTPLGYPAEEPAARPRKSIEQIVIHEKYS
jgi:nitroreductase